jgi:pseudouridine-5'-phosphate glycosidase
MPRPKRGSGSTPRAPRGPSPSAVAAAVTAGKILAGLTPEEAEVLARELRGAVSRRTISLRLPPASLARYRAAARAAGLTLTAWLERAADAALGASGGKP